MAEVQSAPGSEGPGSVREEDKIFLILAYLGPFALIPLLTVKDSEYVRWHAKQGLTLFGAAVAFSLLVFVLSFVPLVNLLVWMVAFVVDLSVFGATIYCIVKAMNGERFKLPLLGDLAQKF